MCQHLRSEFPNLVSYNRFVELIPGTLLPMCVYMYLHQGRTSGIAFVDSTPISVCHNKRIRRHKTFMVYFMLKYRQDYVDPGQDYYEQQYRARVLKNLKRKAKSLGMNLVPTQPVVS